MSHVVNINAEIQDLNALEEACKNLGLELVRGQTSYRWFGRFVGDSPMPKGFTTADLGNCEHAIRVPGKPGAYEIGVVKRRDGKPGYTLLFDYWQGGYGLVEKIGDNEASKLIDHYGACATKNHMKKRGFRITQTIGTDGRVIVKMS